MTDINRSVDLKRVVNRLAAQVGTMAERIAMLETALEETVEQATAFHQENLELKQKLAKAEAELEKPGPPVEQVKRPGK